MCVCVCVCVGGGGSFSIKPGERAIVNFPCCREMDTQTSARVCPSPKEICGYFVFFVCARVSCCLLSISVRSPLHPPSLEKGPARGSDD